MSNKDYKKAIIDSLLKKYNARYAKHVTTNRRIILKPAEIYKDYAKNNADIVEKQKMNEAVSELQKLGFISVDHLIYSDDIEKIYLSEERLDALYEYLRNEYGVVPQSTIAKQVSEIAKKYISAGEIARKYCEDILVQAEDPGCLLIPERVEANLKMLCFLEHNKENLYVREASMLVYGDSKWFENNNYEEICTFLRTATGIVREEGERNDTILSSFDILPAEQEIFIKGSWKIEWEQYTLEVSELQGGIAIASSDIPCIKHISIHSTSMNRESVMTIENKTSYQRMKNSSAAMMYLGGFANRPQIEFLKKVISDNPDAKYQHFGDIDIGGFLIHKHLCRETSKNFELYCMGVGQLCDKRFSHCLKALTENDKGRLESLIEDALYREVLTYMKEHNVKLEQEIISYYLERK
ncbi:MAG: DUF2220 domain-containing protein [Roseburia sp.]|nr:DUF2220 domain-containing protein [Roseburia sp.]